ncbi:MAG: putative DNA-binding mobile mystery protein A [Rhodothermales bacterium]|jgi:predicted DNA-binding mobile mystery protein A
MSKMDDLRIRQLDEALGEYAALRSRPAPNDGWLRTIRDALGMSVRQLATRTGLSKTSVNNAEHTEDRRAIRLETLSRIADGLDCDLVYAIVPRHSLRHTLESQAERIAMDLVGRVSESMELEEQGVPSDESRRQLETLMAEILRDRSRNFWDV